MADKIGRRFIWDKNGKVKLGIVLLLVLLVSLIPLFVSALDVKESYLLGEDLRIDLSDYLNYTLRIETPSSVFLKEGSEDVFRFELSEVGKYSFQVESVSGNKKVSFNVVEFFEIEEAINETNNESAIKNFTVGKNQSFVKEKVEESFGINIDNKKEENKKESLREVVLAHDFEHKSVTIKVIAGEPVLWKKEVILEDEVNSVRIDIPASGKEVVVKVNNNSKEFEISEKVVSRVLNTFSDELGEKEVILRDVSGKVEVEYYLDGPEVKEKIISENKKILELSGQENIGYRDVVVKTNLTKKVNSRSVHVYEITNGRKREINSNKIDSNEDDLIDSVEFVSAGVGGKFEIILIDKAEHLNFNKELIEDISDSVREKDRIWSPIISDGEYVRVIFEEILDNTNDITIFSRIISGNPKVEVYEADSENKIAEFPELIDDRYNKIFLTNLIGKQDTFDLLIIGGRIIFDYIVDPTAVYDVGYGAPRCSISDSPCVAPTSLLMAKGNWNTNFEPNEPNTVDACDDGSRTGDYYLNYESFENLTVTSLNGSEFEVGNTVLVEGWAYCYDGSSDILTIAYTDDASNPIWFIQHTINPCPSAGFQKINTTFVLNNSVGNHVIRGIIQYRGDAGRTCGTGQDDDNDDLVFRVDAINNPPTLPTSITCNGGSCDIEVNQSVELNCSGSIDAQSDIITYFLEGQLNLDSIFENDTFVNLFGTGIALTNYTSRTCIDTWGADCSLTPLSAEGDNTWDSCTSQGTQADESIDTITLNFTEGKVGDTINVDCAIDPYGTSNEIYMWYYNGTGWKTIYSGTAPSGSNYNLIQSFKVDSVLGTHWVRCGIGYDNDDVSDFCVNAGNYFDNDDVNFTINAANQPQNNSNDSVQQYDQVSLNHAQILDMFVKVQVDSYNPSVSVGHNITRPDLRLKVYNGNDYKDLGTFDLNDYYNDTINSTNRNFTIQISDSDVLNAWKDLSNQSLKIIGSNMDFINLTSRDEINYSNIWFSFGAYSWISIGNHSETTSIIWNTSSYKNQFDVELRCEAYDLAGKNQSVGWYSPMGLLDIVHNDIVVPTVTIVSPAQDVINDTSRKPEFRFNVTDDKDLNLSCRLFMQENYLTLVGQNDSVLNNTEGEIVPIQSLMDGTYEWWINCSDGENEGATARQNITILVGDDSGKAFVQAESGRVYLNAVSQFNLTLNNSYDIAHTFIIPDSQMSSSSNEFPANSDANFYFSNVVGGISNQLTIERMGSTDTMVGTYSIVESEYMDVCHVSGSVANTIDVLDIDISTDCSFIPSNYEEKCFISIRNNVKSSSTDNTCKGEGDFMGKFMNSTTARFQAHTRACGTREIMADIVCFNDETQVTPVSTGEVHFSSGVNFNIGHSVNLSNSFLIHSCREEEYGLEDRNSECFFSDNSKIMCRTSTSSTGGTAPQECEVYVVEFPTETYSNVLHHVPLDTEIGDLLNFTSNLTSEIDLNSSALFCSYSIVSGEGTNNPKAEYPAYFVNNNTVGFERGRTGNQNPSHHFSCEAITFPTKKDPILVTLHSPKDNYADYDSDSVNLKFNASVESTANLKSCHLWHNATGYWHLNQTELLGGRNAVTSFWLYGLSNVKFNWNIQCENAREEIVFGKADRSVIIEKLTAPNLTLVSPIGQQTTSPVQINVSSEENLTACNYSINSGQSIVMTKFNDTYYFGEEYYLRNGDNSVAVSCSGENGRVGLVSKDFSFVASLIPRVKNGTTQIANGYNNVSVSLNTDYLANAFLIFSFKSSTSTPSQLQIEGVLNKNNITFSRYSTSGDVDIEWRVVESPNIFVRRGILPFGATSSFVEIDTDSFDLAESFILHSTKLSSGTSSENVRGFFISEFLDLDTVKFFRSQAGNLGEISWQAIEWDGSKVQSGQKSFSGTSSSESLSQEIERQKSFLILSKTLSSGDETLSETSIRGILNSNSLDFVRNDADSTARVSWFVVESLEFGVQNGSYSLSGSNPDDVTINQVNASRAFVVESYSSSGTGTTFANNKFTSQITSDTNLRFDKGTSSQTQTIEWNVVEIGLPLSEFIVLDVPINKSYNSSDLNFSINTKLAATSCKYSLDGASNVSMILVNPTNFIDNVSSLSENNHTVLFYCTDSSSVEYTSELVEFNIDLISPNLVLNLPVDNYNSSSNIINFSFIASDDRGISECSLLVDGEVKSTDYFIVNNSLSLIEMYLSNGIYNWGIECLDLAGNVVASSLREINVSGPFSTDWTSRFYETSTIDFNAVPFNIELSNSRDGVENNLDLNLSVGLNYLGEAVSDYFGNNGFFVSSGTQIDFSAFTEVDTVNSIYLTWKAYIHNSSGDTLLCQAGDDFTGGERISSNSGTWTSNCLISSDVYLKNSDKVKFVVNAYNDAGAVVNLVHRWDNLRLSFMEFSNFKIIGNLYSEFEFPNVNLTLQEAEQSNFSCKVDCSIGECSNVQVTLQYLNAFGEWLPLHNQGDLIFYDGIHTHDLGTITGGTIYTNFSMYAVVPSTNTLRCYSTYDYGNYGGTINPNVTIIRIPRASFISPTPANEIELSQDFIPINMTVNESVLDFAILNFNEVNQTLWNSSVDVNDSYYNFFVNKTGLINGDYNFKLITTNLLGGTRIIERNVAIKWGDSSPPNMTLFGITNNTYYTNGDFNFEIYLDEYGMSCEYDLDEYGRVSMNRNNDTYFTATLNGVSDEGYNIMFYCKDSSNNEGEISIDFIVDSMIPSLEFGGETPGDGAQWSSQDVVIEVLLNESNLDNFIFNWNGTNETIYSGNLVSLIGLDNLASFSEDGNFVKDYVSGSSGNINGANWIDRTAHDGKGAFQFVRSENDYIKMNSPFDYLDKNITLLAWVNTTSNIGEQSVLSFDDSFGSTLLSLGHAAGSDELRITDSYGSYATGKNIVDGNWHLIGLTFYSGKNVTVIFDGVPVYNFTTDVILFNELQFSLGMGYNGVTPSYFYDGFIDNVAVYDKVLNLTELNNSFNYGIYLVGESEYVFKREFTNLSFGDYSYSAYSKDFANWSSMISRTITIKEGDTIAPVVTLNNPINETVSVSSLYNFNFTVNENQATTVDCNLSVGSQLFELTSINNNTLTNQLVSGLYDGFNDWNVVCWDVDLNYGYGENRTIEIRENPLVNLDIANLSWLSAGENLEYIPSDNTNLSSCSLYINGSLFDTLEFIVNGITNSFDINSLVDSYYNWQINCTDDYGLGGISELRNFYKDTESPLISLLNPLNDTPVLSGNVTFNVSGRDNLANQLICNLTVDSNILEMDFALSIGTNHSYNGSLLAGDHYWNVSCIDEAGNYNVSETYVFSNYNSPSISLDMPANDSWINSTDLTVTYNPYDDVGIANCSLYVDGIYNQIDLIIENGVSNSFDISEIEGTHNWSVVCYNSLSIKGFSEVFNFGIDETNPLLIIYHPVGDEIFNWNDVFFNFTYEDNLDSLGNCSVMINSFSEANIAANNGSVSEVTISLSDGNYSWNIKCFDKADNVVQSIEKNFSVVAPPVIDLVSPSNGMRTVNSTLNITYIPRDAAGLTQCSVYLDSVVNDTKNTIFANQKNYFLINGIGEGIHNWSIECIDADLNVGTSLTYDWIRDISSPIVLLDTPLDNAGIDFNLGSVNFRWKAVDVLDQFMTCDLIVDGNVEDNKLVTNNSFTTEIVSGLSVGEHDWNVTCWDRAGNLNNSFTWEFNFSYPDFFINDPNIILNESDVREGEVILINVTVENRGYADSSNVLVQFYQGNPLSGGTQFGNNQTINLNKGQGINLSQIYFPEVGINEIYIIVDQYDDFVELDENNNLGNKNISVGAWQFFYGEMNSESDFALAGSGDIITWNISSFEEGSIFVADVESIVSWGDLFALGKNLIDEDAANDFSDVDSLLKMVGFIDSISNLYLGDENTFSVFGKFVDEVPITNSTNNTNFMTGILWDGNDDTGDGEFNIGDSEDLIFVTKLNENAQGSYGVYDYELRVPAKLREYAGAGSEVVFYVEVF